MTTTPSSTISSAELTASLELIEIKPGLKFSVQVMRDLLPDTETALFFSKVYKLDYRQTSNLLGKVLKSTVAEALFNEGHAHSVDLQDFVVDLADHVPDYEVGDTTFDNTPPPGEVLPQVWQSLEVEIAASIQAVAEKLSDMIGRMPGKQGAMTLQTMAKMNLRRPTIGVQQAGIYHAPAAENLIIFDVSGSMSEHTVKTIVDDVVGMAYMANAHLAIVSNTCTHWEPGSYNSDVVLEAAEFGGTHYEQLTGLLNQDWGTVVCIADYDSSYGSKQAIKQCTGRINELFDVSLVNRPTFLAECVGQLASKVTPMLIASDHARLVEVW